MSQRDESSLLQEIRQFEEALPGRLFERLVAAVRSIGREGLRGSYNNTFWYPLGAAPTNIAEEVVVHLVGLVEPPAECIGIEWWLGRLRYGKKLRYHFDRDLTLDKQTGEYSHPLQASILYLNAFPSSPTVILDQVLGPDGKSRIPAKPASREAVTPVPNRYTVFPGELRHGVIPDSDVSRPPGNDPGQSRSPDLRLSFLVNFWHRRPLPPTCADFDGNIYPSLTIAESDHADSASAAS